MRQSQLFAKTQKNVKNYDSVNAVLLIKGGFIDQAMAGVYSFLPLGYRVLNKIENIIREEIDKIGTELLLPAMVPPEIWQKSGRLESVDILMKAVPANEKSKIKNDANYVLNATHEDVITPIAKKFNFSYKDFPFAIYQIQTKFRNEERPKSGLLRGREFRMKDLYSFHKSEKDLKRYYEAVKDVYIKIFSKIGFGDDVYIALASGGDFTKNYSHEFQVKCKNGEDTIFYAPKVGIAYNKEVAPSVAKKIKFKDKKELPKKDIKGVGIIGVEKLSKFLKIEVERTTKTIIFETEKGEVVVAVVRGDYDISEYKLQKIIRCKELRLASEKIIKKVTGSSIGYAGPINLPKSVKIYYDESMSGRMNFECGANKTNYHTINVNFGRDLSLPEKFYDIKIAKPGDLCPESGEEYEVFKATEVGNIFPLNIKFSQVFDYKFTNQSGQKGLVYMGSYGIGSSRVMGVVVEKFHDNRGIIWPESIAPFKAHILILSNEDKAVKLAEKLYSNLTKLGIDVLIDDRKDVSAGEKFADADLIGVPYRLVISKKTGDKVEIKKRSEEKITLIKMEEVEKLFNV